MFFEASVPMVFNFVVGSSVQVPGYGCPPKGKLKINKYINKRQILLDIEKDVTLS